MSRADGSGAAGRRRHGHRLRLAGHGGRGRGARRSSASPYEVDVVSAHRMPREMLDYGASAAGRGSARAHRRRRRRGAPARDARVGDAAAGDRGPVPLENLDGMDSLLSIVQMPAGVPVATVSVGGARNAGLLAVRILAAADPALRARMADFQASLTASRRRAKGAALRERRRLPQAQPSRLDSRAPVHDDVQPGGGRPRRRVRVHDVQLRPHRAGARRRSPRRRSRRPGGSSRTGPPRRRAPARRPGCGSRAPRTPSRPAGAPGRPACRSPAAGAPPTRPHGTGCRRARPPPTPARRSAAGG